MSSAKSSITTLTIAPTGSRPCVSSSTSCEEAVMSAEGTAWTRWAGEPDGDGFARFHAGLAEYNSARLRPGLPAEAPADELDRDQAVARAEIELVESLRRTIAPL